MVMFNNSVAKPFIIAYTDALSHREGGGPAIKTRARFLYTFLARVSSLRGIINPIMNPDCPNDINTVLLYAWTNEIITFHRRHWRELIYHAIVCNVHSQRPLDRTVADDVNGR